MTLNYALKGKHIVTAGESIEPFWFRIKYEYGLYWLGIGYSPKPKRFLLIGKAELIQWLAGLRISE